MPLSSQAQQNPDNDSIVRRAEQSMRIEVQKRSSFASI